MGNGIPAPRLRLALRLPERVLEARSWLPSGVATITAAAAAFLLHQLMAWPPHEDETLALFVGRDSLGGVVEHVTRERGGAPLHFLLAWSVAHLGLGLGGLRLLSALFAVASLPLVALLGVRLAGRRVALVATAVTAASWIFLFHGVYGRMYSLFLFLSLLSYLALLRALDRGGRSWTGWIAAILLTVATHPYGALVLGSQVAYVLLARRDRLRGAATAGGVVALLGMPFWLTDLVLAGRFEVGVGGGGAKLGGPGAVATYFWRTAGDFSAGWWPLLLLVLGLGAVGIAALRRDARLLVLAVVVVPAAAFVTARLGGSTSPESRHLLFALPFFAVAVAAGLLRATRARPALLAPLVLCLLVAEVAWAWERTPHLFEWEPDSRQVYRGQAEAWLAATSRPDDILFGYEPVFLGAWERNRDFPATVLPRADANLALRSLLRLDRPLGRGVWVLDASERNNLHPRLEIVASDTDRDNLSVFIDQVDPAPARKPARMFEAAAFGPFLVVRSREPVQTPDRYFFLAARTQLLSQSLGLGDSAVNMLTIERADRALRGYGPSLRSRSSNSR